ncbi:hypothetical protein [Dyadobacter sediminis]|uniref:Uncharacterized protein n=1 Tax=Dyadobacter sediminis TaxID=1493691 RepID=A0A5R9KK08_9BACT|nr:hypothetical protein [Dyadobacter sediminis]TLU96558.1 hypothetical protein FEM55_05350 [Dyadobacter sediminis]GGB83219.1 hypothetical protein GCM10011325_08460 [Dyadobacter sediminis]
MEQVNQEFLNRIKGRYTEKYATAMDDWTAIILHEVSEAVGVIRRENSSKLSEGIKEINEASEKIKGQVQQVHFDNQKQAFFYGLGRHLLYGLTSTIGICSVIWIYTTQTDFSDKLEFVNQHPSIEKFQSIYLNGKTISENGYEFLVVYPRKEGNIEFARNYLYDKENNRVLIPIGTE